MTEWRDLWFEHQGQRISAGAFGLSFLPELLRVVTVWAPSAGSFLEWGSGLSTLLLARVAAARGGRLTTLDHDAAYQRSVLDRLSGSEPVTALVEELRGPQRSQRDTGLNYSARPLALGDSFDFILIDGRRRMECALTAFLLSSPETLVAIHDYRRARYQGLALLFETLEEGEQFRVLRARPELLTATAAERRQVLRRVRSAPHALDPEAAPLRAGEVVVGCVAEATPKYLGQARRLVQSIRWFGGELARAEVVVCVVGDPDAESRRALAGLGATVVVVPPFDRRNPFANKLQFFTVAEATARSHFLLLDCDTLVVQDPLPLLRRGTVQAKIAPLPTVTPEVFARLFEHFGLPLPAAHYVHSLTGTATICYCNSGVISLSRELAAQLVPAWRRFNAALAAELSLLHPCEQHCNQASLALALAETAVPFTEAPVELNFQLNMLEFPSPARDAAADPAILHYHHLVDEAGELLPTPFPRADLRIASFNARLRAERRGGRPRPVARSADSLQVMVLGMHRSGTSALTRALALAGCWVGEGDELFPDDSANPRGYWERRDVVALNEAALAAVGARWQAFPEGALDGLDAGHRSHLEGRSREIVAALDEHGSWVIKDPRLCLLFPLWRRALTRPFVVLVHRSPLAVAESLAARDGVPLLYGIALWELYTRQALAATAGLPRALVSYHRLLAAPEAAMAELGAALVERAGLAPGVLELPRGQALRAAFSPTLEHHAQDPERQRGYLNAAQLELAEELESGRALTREAVPPLSAGARELLEAPALAERAVWRAKGAGAALEADRFVYELDALVSAFLRSHGWRIGSTLTRAYRRLLGKPSVLGAAERREHVMAAFAAWRRERR